MPPWRPPPKSWNASAPSNKPAPVALGITIPRRGVILCRFQAAARLGKLRVVPLRQGEEMNFALGGEQSEDFRPALIRPLRDYANPPCRESSCKDAGDGASVLLFTQGLGLHDSIGTIEWASWEPFGSCGLAEAFKLLTESEVERSFRKLLRGEITPEALEKAEALLEHLRPETPLRFRLGAELDEVRAQCLSQN